MDIAAIPIVEFLKFCREGAKNRGFNWVVCVLSRERDCIGLYERIKRDWKSLDSITGKKMLVLFAGNEMNQDSLYEEGLNRFCVTDKHKGYIKRYNPFATIIGNSSEIKTDLSSVRYEILKKHIVNIENNQTDAVSSLRRYFGISEQDIPCLVYSPLYEDKVPVQNIVVPFPEGEVDLYLYFKRLFNIITPLVDELLPYDNKLQERIDNVYNELLSYVRKSQQREIIMEYIQNKQYLTIEQPIRGLLSKYIDLCKLYEKEYGMAYQPGRAEKSELLSKIENAFYNVDIPIVEQKMVNAYVSIGDNNKIQNSTISVVLRMPEYKL